MWKLKQTFRDGSFWKALINTGSPVSAGVPFRRVKTTLAGSVYRPSESFPPTCIHLQLIARFICTLLFQTNECLHLEGTRFPLFTFPSLRFLSVFSSGCPSPSLSFIHLFSLSVSPHFTFTPPSLRLSLHLSATLER